MSADEQNLRIDDPEELSQRKRIKEILNRRKDVIDQRIEAKNMWVAGELERIEAVRLYQNAIQGMILDLRPKMMRSDGDADGNDGEYLLEEKVIDRVVVHPPVGEVPENERDFAAGEDQPEPKTVPIRGLEWFVYNEPVVTRSFTISTWNPPAQKDVVGRSIIGFDVLDKALKECIKFIDASGIDADMEEQEQQTKIDRDLLEEVEEWQANNVE